MDGGEPSKVQTNPNPGEFNITPIERRRPCHGVPTSPSSRGETKINDPSSLKDSDNLEDEYELAFKRKNLNKSHDLSKGKNQNKGKKGTDISESSSKNSHNLVSSKIKNGNESGNSIGKNINKGSNKGEKIKNINND